MNRAARRADEARAKMQRNASRLREAVETRDEAIDWAERFRTWIFALAREQGRVRIRAEQIQALTEHDRVDFLAQANGDVIVQYTQGAP